MAEIDENNVVIRPVYFPREFVMWMMSRVCLYLLARDVHVSSCNYRVKTQYGDTRVTYVFTSAQSAAAVSFIHFAPQTPRSLPRHRETID